MSEGLQVELIRRLADALNRLQAQIAADLYRPMPTETFRLTWRERFAALNRFRWREFWTGVDWRYLPDPDALKGLAYWVSVAEKHDKEYMRHE